MPLLHILNDAQYTHIYASLYIYTNIYNLCVCVYMYTNIFAKMYATPSHTKPCVMYIYVHIYMCVYIHIYYINMYIIHMYICINIYLRQRMQFPRIMNRVPYMYVYIYVRMYAYIYLYTFIYVYIYTCGNVRHSHTY